MNCTNDTYLLEAAEKCVESCPLGYKLNNITKICNPECLNNCEECGDF